MDEPDEFGPQGEEGLAAYPRTWTTEYCLLPPGRAFSYSNSGFALAGLALQEADKKPFADVMRARIFDPLGMTRTTFRPTEAMTWPLAIGHRRDNAGAFSAVRPLPNDARLWPAGTVYSSAQEMARFVIALLNDGRVDGKQALPAGLAATVRTAVGHHSHHGRTYGLGQFLTERTFGHGGTMTGYTAQVDDRSRGRRRRRGAEQRRQRGADADRAGAASRRRRACSRRRRRRRSRRAASSPICRPYVGTYRNPRRFTVEVARSGDGLVLKRFGRDFPLRPSGPDRFVTDLPRGGTETIAFGRGAGRPRRLPADERVGPGPRGQVVRLASRTHLRLIAALSFACASTTCEGPEGLPSAPSSLTTGIVIFEGARYTGKSAHIQGDMGDLSKPDGPCTEIDENDSWDDCVSSIRLSPGTRAVIFVDTNFKGWGRTIDGRRPGSGVRPGPVPQGQHGRLHFVHSRVAAVAGDESRRHSRSVDRVFGVVDRCALGGHGSRTNGGLGTPSVLVWRRSMRPLPPMKRPAKQSPSTTSPLAGG